MRPAATSAPIAAAQRGRVEPEGGVGGQHSHLPGPEAEDPRRARERRVRLVGDVEDEVVPHRPGQRLACARDRGHVPHRAAAHQRAGRLGGVADPLLEPPQHLELDLAWAGRLHPGARVEVAGTCDQVAERTRPGRAERNEAEETRVAVTAREREHVALEAFEDRLERLRLLRRRAGQALPHLGRRGASDRRRLAFEPLDEQVDGAIAKLPPRLLVQRERISLRRNPVHGCAILP